MKVNIRDSDVHFHNCDFTDNSEVLAAISNLKETFMATQAELAVELTAVKDQVIKVGNETRTLISRVETLTTALENAGGTTPEVDAALLAVKEQLVIVDELVPDAPPPPPEPV